MELNRPFWRGRSVFLTGHTGFKGAWLSLCLKHLEADIKGYACEPPTEPSLFKAAGIDRYMESTIGDVRDLTGLRESMAKAMPEIAFHLAAQPLVRQSYADPVSTYSINVMGTVHFLKAVRHTPSVRAAVIVTSDKCYENREWIWQYREDERLGGRDPYSSSKACAELVASAYRNSFLHGRVRLATVRAGNVIGGGDWAPDRLVPDALRAWTANQVLRVRSPGAVRPWQHVFEPLTGYLMVAERLVSGAADEAWNFGPGEADMLCVGDLLDRLAARWGPGAVWQSRAEPRDVHEAHLLRLDSSKARALLGWRPKWDLERALDHVVAWHRDYLKGRDMHDRCMRDVREYDAA